SVEGRAAAVRAALPIVAGLGDGVRRQEYAGLLADRAGVGVASMLVELGRLPGGRGEGGASERRRPGDAKRRASGDGDGNGAAGTLSAGPGRTPQQRVEWDMLKLLAQSEVAFDAAAIDLTEEHFERAGHR